MKIGDVAKNRVEYRSSFVGLAVDIAAAYVANDAVPATELPALIAKVYSAVSALAAGGIPNAAASVIEVEEPTPVQIRKSVQRDGIISFIDGKTYKTLKRHLTSHGLDPRSYRERYGLPADYPMVAPSYAEKRSALAKGIGLGVPGAFIAPRRTGTNG